MKERIPTSYKQVILLGLLVAVPILLSAVVVLTLDDAAANGKTDLALGIFLLVVSGLLSAAVCGSMLARRSIEVDGDVLTIRHSFYSFSFNRRALSGIDVTTVPGVGSLGITSKRNGIAAFGYYSGWFNDGGRERVFLALSVPPITRLHLHGHPRCAFIALSCSERMSTFLRAWSHRS